VARDKNYFSYQSKYQARMIYEKFLESPDAPKVFIDIDSIEPGVDFEQVIRENLRKCDTLVALVGPGWVEANDPETGLRRLDNPKDFVRLEIGGALKHNIPVVPVLLDEVSMPKPDQLPDELKGFHRLNAEFVSFRTFDADVERLIEKLKKLTRKNEGFAKRHSLRPINASAPRIFVSYRADTRLPDDDRQRFASYLCSQLAFELSYMGVPYVNWRFRAEINPADDWNDVIVDEIRKSDLFLIILSESYIRSPWCNLELQEIQRAAKGSVNQSAPKRTFLIRTDSTSEIPRFGGISEVLFFMENHPPMDELRKRVEKFEDVVRKLALAIQESLAALEKPASSGQSLRA
jgi:hypothetical protein